MNEANDGLDAAVCVIDEAEVVLDVNPIIFEFEIVRTEGSCLVLAVVELAGHIAACNEPLAHKNVFAVGAVKIQIAGHP